MPRLDNLLHISEDKEFTELLISDDETNINVQCEEMWNKNLGLTMGDRDDLINNRKLNSSHMEAVKKLLRKQVGQI